MKIYYVEGYKYQLKRDFIYETGIKRKSISSTDYLRLDDKGTLTIKSGYAWNGCSGPTIDDKTNMRACLVHDALYQLMRLELLGLEYRKDADKVLHDIATKDIKHSKNKLYHESLKLRYDAWYEVLRLAGENSAMPWSEPEILEAP